MLTRREFLRTGTGAVLGGLAGCLDEPGRRGERGAFDLCVVGSGFAGTHLALQTTAAGLRTAVVEAGSEQPGGLGALGDAFRTESAGELDYPAEQTRLIALGGSSNHWAGAVNRLRPSDFHTRSAFGLYVDWPLEYSELEGYYCRAERALATRGFPPVPGSEPERSCPYPFGGAEAYRAPRVTHGLELMHFFPVARSSAGGSGGPVRLVQEEIPRLLESPQAALFAGRRAVELVVDAQGRVEHLRLRAADGSEERIHARCFVVAAGTLETPRLLLASRSERFPRGLGNHGDQLGRFFVEHPAILWEFRARNLAALEEGVHRSHDLNDRFRASGLNACQFQLHVSAPDRVVWKLHPEIEPRPENRVQLSAAERDAFGDPRPVLHFSFSERDQRSLDHGLEELADLTRALGGEPQAVEELRRWRAHPAGTCRMARDAGGGVVDADCRVFGVDNLYVSGASVFPTSGTSNPTLSVVALTLRLAEHLIARLAAGPAGPAGAATAAATARPPAEDFWVVGWGQPNTARHLRALAREFRHVEVDLLLDSRGRLVGAHDPEKLAKIERGEIADALTLPDLLALPFSRIFLDMKDTLPAEGVSSDDPGFRARTLRALGAAADAIAESGRQDEVFVMSYAVDAGIASAARARGLQLMLQGYPRDEAAALALVQRAAQHGIAQVCIPLARTSDAVLAESRRLGVAHVPYTFFQEPWGAEDYRRRIRGEPAPLRGLILPRGPAMQRFLELLGER